MSLEFASDQPYVKAFKCPCAPFAETNGICALCLIGAPTVPRDTAFMAASTSGRNQLQQAGTTLSLSILSGTPRYKLFVRFVCKDWALYQGYAFVRTLIQSGTPRY